MVEVGTVVLVVGGTRGMREIPLRKESEEENPLDYG